MADLGSIQRVNENAGTQPVDTRALESGISEGLGLVAELHTQKVLRKAGDEVKQDLAQAGQDALQTPDAPTTDESLTDDENRIRRKIRAGRWRNQRRSIWFRRSSRNNGFFFRRTTVSRSLGMPS